MEKNRYYCELPGDVWEEGTLMWLIKQNQEQRVRWCQGGRVCWRRGAGSGRCERGACVGRRRGVRSRVLG